MSGSERDPREPRAPASGSDAESLSEQRAFEEYLNRQSALSRHYREQATSDVPPELDRSIIEHAHAAVAPQPRVASRWMRWSAPLAVAASVVLVAVIVFDRGVQERSDLSPERTAAAIHTDELLQMDKHREEARREETPPPTRQEPAPPNRQVAAPRSSSSSAISSVPAEASVAESASAPASPRASVPEPASAPTPALASGSAPASAQPSAAKAEEVRRAPARADVEAPMVPAAEAERARMITGTVQQASVDYRDRVAHRTVGLAAPEPPLLEPQEWLARIRELREEGKAAEADEQWQHFIAAYPQHPVAEDDPARAPSVAAEDRHESRE